MITGTPKFVKKMKAKLFFCILVSLQKCVIAEKLCNKYGAFEYDNNMSIFPEKRCKRLMTRCDTRVDFFSLCRFLPRYSSTCTKDYIYVNGQCTTRIILEVKKIQKLNPFLMWRYFSPKEVMLALPENTHLNKPTIQMKYTYIEDMNILLHGLRYYTLFEIGYDK
jgi:hypothetical protein